MVPLEHGGLQRGNIALRGGVVAAGQRLPQRQDIAGDGGIQLQRRVRVQVGGQGELKLLELQLQRLDLADGLQSAVVGVDPGQHLSYADPLALLPHPAEGAILGGQHLLVPQQPAVEGDGVLRLSLRHQRGVYRVRQVVVQLYGEIDQHRRQHGDGQYFHEGMSFSWCVPLCSMSVPRARTLTPPAFRPPAAPPGAAARWWRWRACR